MGAAGNILKDHPKLEYLYAGKYLRDGKGPCPFGENERNAASGIAFRGRPNVKHHGKSAFAQLAHMKKLQRLCAMGFLLTDADMALLGQIAAPR